MTDGRRGRDAKDSERMEQQLREALVAAADELVRSSGLAVTSIEIEFAEGPGEAAVGGWIIDIPRPRTLSERLFSRPWRPWMPYKWKPTRKP